MRSNNPTGIRNLCAVAMHLRQTMPANAATNYAVRTVLREAINKSNPQYQGNVNRKNCRHLSVAAERRLAEDPKAPLVADHAVPVSITLKAFAGASDPTLDSVVNLVAKYAVMVLVTPREDACLRAAGLVKSMPANWDEKDPFARYKHVGIEIKANAAFRGSQE